MKLKQNLTPKTTAKVTVRNRLKYVVAVTSLTLAIFSVVFIYNNLSSNKSAMASTNASDNQANALLLRDLNHWQSDNAAYSTGGATADGQAPSCWTNGPNNNVWFKFRAVFDTVTVQVKTGGSEGTLLYPKVALLDSSGTVLGCAEASSASEDLSISYNNLTAGNTYFIEVDNGNTASDTGTFTLAVNNVSVVEYWAIDNKDWDKHETWSTTEGGQAGNSVPGRGNVVHIKGYTITVDENAECAALIIEVDEASGEGDDNNEGTGLSVEDHTLTVYGNLSMTNPGNNQKGSIKVKNTAKLVVKGNMTLSRQGGDKDFKIEVKNSALLSVWGNLQFTATSGNKEISFKTDNTAQVRVGGNLSFTWTGGDKIKSEFESGSQLTVTGNLNLDAASSNKIELTFKDNTLLNLGGNINRLAGTNGTVSFTNNSELVLAGSSVQTLTAGNGIDLNKLTINNNSPINPAVVLGSPVSLSGTLTLTNGVLQTDATNLLTLENGTTVSGGSASSYIDGPVKKVGNESFIFPLGNNGAYAPLGISAPSNSSAAFTARYYGSPYSNTSSMGPGLQAVSAVEYWILNQNSGNDQVKVTLYWNDGARSGISNPASLTLARWNGTQWVDAGPVTASGTPNAGSIQSNNNLSQYGNFTFGSNGAGNTLPIKLLSFNAKPDNGSVRITWSTAMELNNDFFTIERSEDGQYFEELGTVTGAGSTNERQDYEFYDDNPLSGTSYYRLKQTDYNGEYEYFPMVAVNMDNGINNVFDQITVGPNPFTDAFTLSFYAEANATVEIVLMNMNGQVIERQLMEVQYGENQYRFTDRYDLPTGMYFVNIMQNGELISRQRIMKN